jgi:hypothetical protein
MEKAMTNFEIQYLGTQYLLVVVTAVFYFILVRNEKRRTDKIELDELKRSFKVRFRNAGNAAGLLQVVGQSLRKSHPSKVIDIVKAYSELIYEEPGLRLPDIDKFLENMDHVEAGLWPEAWPAKSGIFKYVEKDKKRWRCIPKIFKKSTSRNLK